MSRIRSRTTLAGWVAISLCAFFPASVLAQGVAGGGGLGGFGGGFSGGGGGQAGGAGGQGGGGQGAGGQAGGGNVGGIMVDAQGVVRPAFSRDSKGKVDQKRKAELAGKLLPADLNTYSPLRKVSLVQLEAACEEYAKKKESVPNDMHYLAGLQRIDYIFIYPEEKDVVIAGPAEGFVADSVGRAVGLTTGRPPLRLDDLIVAMRALERGGSIGCSIDPVQERLAAFKAFVAQNSDITTPEMARERFERMPVVLGMQNVSVFGVPPESHFAEVLVEADYRMKRLSIGVDPPPVRGLRSHLSMIGPGANTMQRWWFTPLYTALIRTEDHLGFQIAGPRVQLLSEEEQVSDTGERSASAFKPVSIQRYAKQFTEKFPELANATPVFAELQGLFDFAILAALFKKEHVPQKADWNPTLFLDEERAAFVKYPVPRQVPSVVNYKMSGGRLFIGLVGGGVTINPMQTLARVEYQTDGSGKMKAARAAAQTEKRSEKHRWWWD